MSDEAAGSQTQDMSATGPEAAPVEIPDEPTAQAMGEEVVNPEGVSADDEDAGYDAYIEAQEAGKPSPAKASGQAIPKPEPKQSAEAKGKTPNSEPAAPAAPALNERDAELIKRFKLEASDLPANPERRAAMLANLLERHNAQAQMYRELQEAKKANPSAPAPQTQGQQQQQPTQTTPDPDEDAAYAPFFEILDQGQVKTFRDYHRKSIQKVTEAIRQQMTDAFKAEVDGLRAALGEASSLTSAFFEQIHEEQGLDDARKVLKDAVEIDGKKGAENLEKLKEKAAVLFRANFNPKSPRSYTYRHALKDAAGSTFTTELQLAERKKLATSQRQAIRGSGEPVVNPARRNPPMSEDDMYSEAADHFAEGGKEAAERFASTVKR